MSDSLQRYINIITN